MARRKAAARKPGMKRASAKRKTPKHTYVKKARLDPQVEENWDAFATELISDVHEAIKLREKLRAAKPEGKAGRQVLIDRAGVKSDAKRHVQPPFDKPDSILKRGVYRFVRHYSMPARYHRLETVLDFDIENERSLRVPFEENPYHWVFLALKGCGLKLSAPDITRYSRQLIYADRHEIDPNLLIGFLYQTGSPGDISKKYLNPAERETWFVASKNTT